MRKYPENQDWQKECRVCRKVKCPTPEKVAEWMRAATDNTFREVEHFAHEDPRFNGGPREQAQKFTVYMELFLMGWSRCLEGVCFDCQETTFPEEHARLDDPEGMAMAHWRRWAFAAPLVADQRRRDAIRAEVLADVAATGPEGERIAAALRPPATVKIQTSEGEKEVPCAWARGGLVVVMLGEAGLERSRAERAAGDVNAYPTQCWSITHAASGWEVAASWDMPDEAVNEARRLLPLLDWTLPMDKVAEAVKANPEAQRAVSLARTIGSL